MLDPEAIRRRVRARLEEQRVLVESLLELREQLGGSLFARWGECGKPSCACREGRKHGPYYVLSTRSGGKGAFAYLEVAQAHQARDLVDRHREIREGLRKLHKINVQLVDLLRRYQAAMVRRGGARLGFSARV
jgi:hypothetical protein